MKQVKFILPAVISVVALLSACNNSSTPATESETNTIPSTATYNIVADESSVITWKGVMLGIKEHFGTVSFKEGSFEVKDGKVVGGSFVADLTNITPTDANYDPKSGYGPEKLVQHLQSPDFFDVANHPTATFVINSSEGSTAKGTLTLRGVSNEETLTDISISENGDVVTATGKLVFDRKKYGVAFDMPAKDMVISNDITLTVTLTGKK